MKANTLYRMDASGMLEEMKKRPELPKGTIIKAYGPGMEESTWATTGNGPDIVKLSLNYADSYFSDPFSKLDGYARPVSEKFGIGFYYDLEAPRATDEGIRAAIARGNDFLAEREAEKRKAEAEHTAALEYVRKRYGKIFTEKPSGTYTDAAHVAKNIRTDLRMNFPGCKFSVRKESYDCIRIEWTDGPTSEALEKVAGKHKRISEYDPYNPDLPDYRDTAFTEVFGGVDFIYYGREYTPERVQAYESEILAMCPGLANDVHERDVYDLPGFTDVVRKYGNALSGRAWYNATAFARAILSGLDLSGETEKADKPNGSTAGISIVDYSEKAIAIVGETKAIRERLKDLGGKFNSRLTCGAGWIFSKKKENEVKLALGL